MAKKLNLIRKVVSFTKSQKTDLTCIAGDMGITVSELLRRIIDEWLSRQSKESGG
jgi:Icc-related predicted phosphoesterase